MKQTLFVPFIYILYIISIGNFIDVVKNKISSKYIFLNKLFW